MDPMLATVSVLPYETRVLVQRAKQDCLIARLPPLRTAHRWALHALLESLALWGQCQSRVVLYVDESCDWEFLGLADLVELWENRLHFDVQVVPEQANSKPVRAKRLNGLGTFSDERRRLRRGAEGA